MRLTRGLRVPRSGDFFPVVWPRTCRRADRSRFDRSIDEIRHADEALGRSGYERPLGTRAAGAVTRFARAGTGLLDDGLQRGTKSANSVADRPVDPAAVACQDMALTNGVN
jgi:hypothetical protein